MWTSVTECCVKMVRHMRRKSVLYVCERVNGNVDGAMAAARERTSSSRYATARSVQKDPTHGFPIQVSLPDGETSHHHFNPCLRHNGGPEQEAEMVRGYLKPPENKSLSDMECLNSSRSFSMGVLGIHDDWEGTQSCVTPALSSAQSHRSYNNISLHPKHRHSNPLEPQNTCHSHYSMRGNALTSGSSTFSLSSSSSSVSSSSNVGGSPKGRIASFQMQFFPPFLSAREKGTQEGSGRKSGRSSRGQGTPQPILRNPSPSTALEHITVVSCGAADICQTFQTDISHSDHVALPQGMYGNMPTDLATAAIEDKPPSIYSEGIDSPSLYNNDSRPERRTNSGKI
ncbi:hypothetical protein Avbf_06636 [Armadillidium vulgare]|nr:hypothetical protein Avbf_06636 [Armadillidium vulgare]